MLDQSGSVQIDGLTYTFEREQQFTGLRSNATRHRNRVAGLSAADHRHLPDDVLPHHRIWIRVTPEAGGGSLVQLASPDRQDATFTRQFAEVAAGLAGALGEATHWVRRGRGEGLEPGRWRTLRCERTWWRKLGRRNWV